MHVYKVHESSISLNPFSSRLSFHFRATSRQESPLINFIHSSLSFSILVSRTTSLLFEQPLLLWVQSGCAITSLTKSFLWGYCIDDQVDTLTQRGPSQLHSPVKKGDDRGAFLFLPPIMAAERVPPPLRHVHLSLAGIGDFPGSFSPVSITVTNPKTLQKRNAQLS